MEFDKNKSIENIGKKLGFLVGYLLFTTILHFILTYLNKVPEAWTYFNTAGITLLIVLVGLLIARILK